MQKVQCQLSPIAFVSGSDAITKVVCQTELNKVVKEGWITARTDLEIAQSSHVPLDTPVTFCWHKNNFYWKEEFFQESQLLSIMGLSFPIILTLYHCDKSDQGLLTNP